MALLTVAEFRLLFPAFADEEKYPTPTVQGAIDRAYRMLPACAWDELLNDGVGLYAAHVLYLRGPVGGSGGGGAVGGLVTSKKVDRVQVNYDVSRTSFEGQAYYNQSAYGVEFWQLALVIGTGPRQFL